MQSKTSADTLLKLKKNINISKCMVYIIFLVVLSLFAIFIGGSFFSLNNILNIICQTDIVRADRSREFLAIEIHGS